MTGILRAGKEGIFSGLNNLRVFTLLDTKFSDKFGFTDSEVLQFLKDYSMTHRAGDIKEWYDGYSCGKEQSLYNPWSFIECVDNEGDLLPYWANTSDNLLVKKLIAQSDETVKSELEDVLSGISIKKEIRDAIIFPGIEDDPNALWSLLLFTGYATFHDYSLKGGKKWCTLILPNKEIQVLFNDLIHAIFKQSLTSRKINDLQEALITGNDVQFAELLQEFVMNSMSVFDIPSNEPEKSYHLFVLGLLVLMSDHYQVQSRKRLWAL